MTTEDDERRTFLAMAMLNMALGAQDDESVMSHQSEYKNAQQTTCICGGPLIKIEDAQTQLKSDNRCSICGVTRQTVMVTCNNGDKCPQSKRSRLLWCTECAKHIGTFNTNPIEEEHNTELLYFVYNKHEILGPHTKSEIISLYVMNKIRGSKLWITDAIDPQSDWCKVVLPDGMFRKLKDNDPTRMRKIAEIKEKNKAVKAHFPELYDGLIENVMMNKVRKAMIPTAVPREARQGKVLLWLTHIIGKILTTTVGIIIGIHIVPMILVLIIPVCCICCPMISCWICISSPGMSRKCAITAQLSFIILFYNGMIILPGGAVYSVMTYMDWYDEIQSWMIAYVAWGFFSFCASAAIITGVSAKIINSIMPAILGVHFGEVQVTELHANDFLTSFSILFMFPSLASFVPAAIVGFIANYVLEEQFELKCSEEIENTAICFDDGHGCCEVISSHELVNSYEFIGGLASNIIATWAVIRIAGYFMINASPSLALYVHRQ